jgi:hypothetical protein
MRLRFSPAQLKYLAPAIFTLLYVLQPAGASSAVQSAQDHVIPAKALARMMIPGTPQLCHHSGGDDLSIRRHGPQKLTKGLRPLKSPRARWLLEFETLCQRAGI